MGASTCLLILMITAIFKMPGVYSSCSKTSPGCGGGEKNSVTIQCLQTTDNFQTEVLQRNCLGYRGYLNKNNRQYLNMGPNFEIYLKMSQFNFLSDPFFNMRYLELFVREISIEDSNFISLPSGLRDFENVNTLNVNHNSLEKITLNKIISLSKLMTLNASYNTIYILEEEADDSETIRYSSTMTIDLSHNRIENIPDNYFVHFTKLKNLNLSHNSIRNINILTFEGISQLETLDLSNNKLSEIGHSLVRFINLKELLLSYNNIHNLLDTNFNTMSQLEKLNISANIVSKIEDDTFTGLICLSELDLNNNSISVIRNTMFTNNSALHLLNLSQNMISFIEPGSFEGKNITSFHFEKNFLKGSLKQSTFEGIYTQTLDLSNGSITLLESEAFINSHVDSLNLSSNLISNISKTAFKLIHHLTKLDLSNNMIGDLDFETTDIKGLVELKAKNNSLKKIVKTTFENLRQLQILDLSNNKISEIEFQSFLDLEKLHTLLLKYNVLFNSLEANTFKGLSSLQSLILSFTRIHSFKNDSFAGLSNLTKLDASHGELAIIEYNVFKNTGSIETLDLSYNLLEHFSINTLCIPLLESLFLNDNTIRYLDNRTFFGFSNLVTLNLNNNIIVKLESTVFHTLSNIQNLYLSSNSDIVVSGAVFGNLEKLSEVQLSNNRKQVSFENVTTATIKRLDLSSCQIKNANTIFLFNLHNLEMLNLSSNKLTFIDKFTFQRLPDLLWLDLSFNSISFIQPGSFLYTNSISILNLHSNDLSALQFGTFDGLRELEILNLSSNALHSIEISVLHKTPHISKIALDNNAIEDMKLHQFLNTSIKVLSIGGNRIDCEVLVSLKKERLEGITVTAETLDFHSENVDGIQCRSDSKHHLTVNWPIMNSTDVNATVAFVSLKNAIDKFTKSIEKIGVSNEIQERFLATTNNFTNVIKSIANWNNDNYHFNDLQITNMTNLLKSIDKHIGNNNNKTETIANVLNELFAMVHKFTNSNALDVSVEDQTIKPYPSKPGSNGLSDQYLREKLKVMLDEEKKKMFVELKSMFYDLKNNNLTLYATNSELKNERSDYNGMIYFIAVCLVIIFVFLIYKIVYKFVNMRKRVVRSDFHSSSQPITNALEME